MLSKKKRVHVWTCSVLLLLNILSVSAQEENSLSDWSIGGDLVTRFYWRGMNLSESPAFQPYIECRIGAVTLGSWGSYSFSKEPYQEIDMYVSFEMKNARITVYDYFSPTDSMDVSHHYFDWHNQSTAHAVEVIVEAWGILGTPFSLEAGVFVYGDDKSDTGDNYYSAYFEPRYHFSAGENEIRVFAGFTPMESLYADQFDFVNVGIMASREIQINDNYSLPFIAQVAVNPNSESVFMIAGISF